MSKILPGKIEILKKEKKEIKTCKHSGQCARRGGWEDARSLVIVDHSDLDDACLTLGKHFFKIIFLCDHNRLRFWRLLYFCHRKVDPLR